MGGRAGDAPRLPAPDRPSHQSSNSTSYHYSPRPPPKDLRAERGSPTAERSPQYLASSAGRGRSEQSPHTPHYHSTTASRQPRDLPVEDQTTPRGTESSHYTRYDRGRGDRRSQSPARHAGPSARPRSSSPLYRSRSARASDSGALTMLGGSADSEGPEDSVKSDDPQSYHQDGGRSQGTRRDETERYRPPDDMDAAMSSMSEPTSRPRSPHKRRTRMLMSRNQWQALSRLWDRVRKI